MEGGEEGANAVKLSEAKGIVTDLLCRTLHSFWPFFHSPPCPPFPHGRRRRSTPFPLLLVLGSRFSVLVLTRIHSLVPRFSFSRAYTPSFLVSPLSPRLSSNLVNLLSHHPLHHVQSDSLPHPCCAAPFSPPRPRCLTLAASPSLPHPRRFTLAA